MIVLALKYRKWQETKQNYHISTDQLLKMTGNKTEISHQHGSTIENDRKQNRNITSARIYHRKWQETKQNYHISTDRPPKMTGNKTELSHQHGSTIDGSTTENDRKQNRTITLTWINQCSKVYEINGMIHYILPWHFFLWFNNIMFNVFCQMY